MDSTPLRTLVYVSALVAPWSEGMIEAIVRDSRDRNARAGVTGVLLHCDGSIMQCLEGPETAVRATFQRIANDVRHTNLIITIDIETSVRTFPTWLMGHLQVTRSEFLQLESAEWRRVAAQTPAGDAAAEGAPGLALLRHFAATARGR